MLRTNTFERPYFLVVIVFLEVVVGLCLRKYTATCRLLTTDDFLFSRFMSRVTERRVRSFTSHHPCLPTCVFNMCSTSNACVSHMTKKRNLPTRAPLQLIFHLMIDYKFITKALYDSSNLLICNATRHSQTEGIERKRCFNKWLLPESAEAQTRENINE